MRLVLYVPDEVSPTQYVAKKTGRVTAFWVARPETVSWSWDEINFTLDGFTTKYKDGDPIFTPRTALAGVMVSFPELAFSSITQAAQAAGVAADFDAVSEAM